MMTKEMYSWLNTPTDFQGLLKACHYDVDVLKYKIEVAHKEKDIRQEQEYKDAKDAFIEVTMSCNPKEAVSHMKHFMADAIAYGIATKNRDWQHKFLAANDLFGSLVKTVYQRPGCLA